MLTAVISPADIKIGLESTERDECFAELLEVLVANNPKIKRTEAISALLEREEKLSTAIFPYVAVPHAILSSMKGTAIAIGVSRTGIEFESPDSENNSKNPIVNVIFEILFEENNAEFHLHVLRDILQLVSNPEFISGVLQAKTSQEVYDLIESLE